MNLLEMGHSSPDETHYHHQEFLKHKVIKTVHEMGLSELKLTSSKSFLPLFREYVVLVCYSLEPVLHCLYSEQSLVTVDRLLLLRK